MTIASPHSELPESYEVVIIGSGYGGAIAAQRFSEKGFAVCVLERGKEYEAGEFPTQGHELLENLQSNLSPKKSPSKLVDFRVYEDAAVIIGSGLGGTSLINASVMMKADPKVFQDPRWPSAFRDDPSCLDTHYSKAEAMLGLDHYPEHFPKLPRIKELNHFASATGNRSVKTPIAVNFKNQHINDHGVERSPCIGCGSCITGCNHNAKNSVDKNYIPSAKRLGAKFFTEVSVRSIEKLADHDYLVHCEVNRLGRMKSHTIRTKNLVLSAGSLGTTEILLKSRSIHNLMLSPQLGKGFSLNSGTVSLLYGTHERLNTFGVPKAEDLSQEAILFSKTRADGKAQRKSAKSPVGPTITTLIDSRDFTGEMAKGFVLEDAAIPSPLSWILRSYWTFCSFAYGKDPGSLPIKSFPSMIKSLVAGPQSGIVSQSMCVLGVGFDQAQGELRLSWKEGSQKSGLELNWPSYKHEPNFQSIADYLEKFRAIKGGIVVDYKGLGLGRPVSVHPLGGCRMADSFADGVTDDQGRVFDGETSNSFHKGLYIFDASLIPTALGCNPALTISAVSERGLSKIRRLPMNQKLIETQVDRENLSLRVFQGAQKGAENDLLEYEDLANDSISVPNERWPTVTTCAKKELRILTKENIAIKLKIYSNHEAVSSHKPLILVIPSFGKAISDPEVLAKESLWNALLSLGVDLAVLDSRFAPSQLISPFVKEAYCLDHVAGIDIPLAISELKKQGYHNRPIFLMGIGVGGLAASLALSQLQDLSGFISVNQSFIPEQTKLSRPKALQELRLNTVAKEKIVRYEAQMRRMHREKVLGKFHRRAKDPFQSLPVHVGKSLLQLSIPILLLATEETSYRSAQREAFGWLKAQGRNHLTFEYLNKLTAANFADCRDGKEAFIALIKFFEECLKPREKTKAMNQDLPKSTVSTRSLNA